ncbi:hypothetical protein ACFQS6_11440 [Xanthomonas populi]|uniref:hypothetical protein n=1 Tax=Xanthomonas populi TaxID=53414 RepID=UPI00244D70E7|nr:hypothetical protein [Xanthomonas populi]
MIPPGFTLAWRSIFGNSALHQLLHHGQGALAQEAIDAQQTVLYSLLQATRGDAR